MLPVILPTDIVAWLLVAFLVWAVYFVRRSEDLSRRWKRVFARPAAAASAAILGVFLLTALADSIHWRDALPPAPGAAQDAPAAYSAEVKSLLTSSFSKGSARQGTNEAIRAPLQRMNSTARPSSGTARPFATTSRSSMPESFLPIGQNWWRSREGPSLLQSLAV